MSNVHYKENPPEKKTGTPPPPPKPPLGRRRFEGGNGEICPKCHSSIKMGGFLWLIKLGCIHPRCENYYGKK